ncbi:MAG: outer membrane beta-barrel protein [Bacteroidales bacterium]|jgi:hypothetical protein|nr:outer membrane beta-barrel protein [Bacteroidales bacterium]
MFFILPLFNNVSAQNCLLTGKVADSIVSQPISLATIKLLQLPDSVLYMGTITNDIGFFVLKNLNKGNYICEISYIGYITKSISIELSNERQEYIINQPIFLERNIQLLNDIEITEASNISIKLDRTVYTIDANMLKGVNTTIDVLRNIPEVTVNYIYNTAAIDGSNGNTIVMINGVFSQTSINLSAVDPKKIENIEIITSPSSEYASEVGSIINITLKEGTVGISTLFELKSIAFEINSGSFNFDLFKKKFHYSFFYSPEIKFFNNIKDTIFEKINGKDLVSENYSNYEKYNFFSQVHTIENRIDYSINKKTFVNITAINDFELYKATIKYNNFYTLFANSLITDIFYINGNKQYDNFSGTYTLFYRQQFSRENSKIAANFNFHHSNSDNCFDYLLTQKAEKFESEISLFNKTTSTRYSYNGKIDYSDIILKKININSGILGYYQIFNSQFNDGGFADTTYKYSNLKIYGYVDFVFKIKNTQIRIGNKVESLSNYYNGIKINNQFSYLPSISIMQKISNFHTLRFNYRKTSEYPSVWQLQPYFVFSPDSLSYSSGNPNLLPQFIHYVNTHYLFKKNKVSLQIMPEFSYVDKMITTVQFIKENNIIFNTNENVEGKTKWSLMSLFRYQTSSFDLTINITPFFEYINYYGYRQNISFSSKLSSYYLLPKQFFILLECNYKYKVLTTLGYSQNIYPSLVLAIMKQFLNNNASFMLGYCFSTERKITAQNPNNLNGFYRYDEKTIKINGVFIKFSYAFRYGKKNYKKEELEKYNDKDVLQLEVQ